MALLADQSDDRPMRSLSSRLLLCACLIVSIVLGGSGAVWLAMNRENLAEAELADLSDALEAHLLAGLSNEEARVVAHSAIALSAFPEASSAVREARGIKADEPTINTTRATALAAARSARDHANKNRGLPLSPQLQALMDQHFALLERYHGEMDRALANMPQDRQSFMSAYSRLHALHAAIAQSHRQTLDEITTARLASRLDVLAAKAYQRDVLSLMVTGVFAVLIVLLGTMLHQLARFRAAVTLALNDLDSGRPIKADLGRNAATELKLVALSLTRMQGQADQILDAGRRESQATLQAAARINRLEDAVQGFEAQMMSVVTEMDRGAVGLGEVARALSHGAQTASQGVATLSGSLERADASVANVASNSADMAVSIVNLSGRLHEAFGTVRSASMLAHRTNGSVDDLGKAVERIGEVVALIRSIAEQTNLLALNATIEAARAGEAGRGFAVVANEVKSLAGRTAQATHDISEQIDAIQRTTGESIHAIRAIVEQIGHAEIHAEEMSVVITEQNDAVREMAECARLARERAEAVKQDAERVREEIDASDRNVARVSAASADITQAAKRIDGAMRVFLEQVSAA